MFFWPWTLETGSQISQVSGHSYLDSFFLSFSLSLSLPFFFYFLFFFVGLLKSIAIVNVKSFKVYFFRMKDFHGPIYFKLSEFFEKKKRNIISFLKNLNKDVRRNCLLMYILCNIFGQFVNVKTYLSYIIHQFF